MGLPKLVFQPPKELRILSVVQILFSHPQTGSASVCKVDIGRLNKKLQKLQKEGMFIVGVFFIDLDSEKQIQPVSSGGGTNV